MCRVTCTGRQDGQVLPCLMVVFTIAGKFSSESCYDQYFDYKNTKNLDPLSMSGT